MRNLQETSTQRARNSEFKDDLIHFAQFFLCLDHVFTGGSLRVSVCVSLRDALVANNSKATQAKGEGDRDRDLHVVEAKPDWPVVSLPGASCSVPLVQPLPVVDLHRYVSGTVYNYSLFL